MKKIIGIISILVISFSVSAQTGAKTQILEVSCGQCNFGLTDQKGCDLAAKIDGKAYWVTGTDINRHGDSHAADGFCKKVRKAEVVGEVVDGKFKVTQFKLLPTTSTKKGHEGHHHD